MKFKHFLLFTIASITLIYSDLAGGSLIALFAWLQIYNLHIQNNFNRQTQIFSLKVLLAATPLLFFWGSIHSFLFIYLNERNIFGIISTSLICFFLCLFANLFFILCFNEAISANYKLIPAIDSSIKKIKIQKKEFLKTSFIIFLFSLIPILSADWKILFAIMATHLFLNRQQLKQAYDLNS